ncbi:Protein dip1 [Penicillium subrubescens]|uniref:Protein dip1 n=1 Tax=Penicillium subrubescens TaxID=1316194 RepID=A0A1Q5SXF3_9EURO|nr:Protein dip1 [Penicillium subrubescens]
MEPEVSEPQQFWNDDFLSSEYDISRCSYKLFASTIFGAHADYVRRQIVYCLLQEDDLNTLHFIASFLLFDGRQNEAALQMMNEEGVFARLLELIQSLRRDDTDGGAGLHQLLMDLLYEMSRIQRIKIEDLVLVDDDFIRCLFDIIEDLSYDVTDPYHYPVIRVLLVLNEQFMISAHDPVDERSSSSHLTNKVIKVLSVYGSLYKTFGENIILLINREELAANTRTAETSLQLLTLKLLYLIFTTPSTYEYFFTNDLHVLVDILIRNLLDLPEEASALRHTYLRVLYPLLAHTQLRLPPHYKRDELRRLLSILVRGQVSYGNETEQEKIIHFEEVDETTRRLVGRCATVDWLREHQDITTPVQEIPTQIVTATIDTVLDEGIQQDSPIDMDPIDVTRTLSHMSTIPDSPGTTSPTRMDSLDSRGSSEAPESRRKLSAIHRLGMQLEPASASSLSVQAVAAQHEKPGVITPSRNDGRTIDLVGEAPTLRAPKIKPEPPKSRRWRGRRLAVDEDDQHSTGTSSDRNTIPEGVEISPTSTHTAPTPTPTTPSSTINATATGTTTDRRNSTTTSHLIPPGHPRRSASNPPPALPPPRRSTQTTPSTSHHRPAPASTGPSPTPSTCTSISINKHGQKPAPPKTRRWGRGKAQAHAHTDSVESGVSTGSQAKESDSEAVALAVSGTADAQAGEDGGMLPDPFSPTSPVSPTLLVSTADEKGAAQPVSVEEAVQNVSLH